MITRTADPHTYIYVRSLFTTIYLMWAGLWAIVAYHYGRSAYVSWLTADGKLLKTVYYVISPFWWAVRETVCSTHLFGRAQLCQPRVSTVPSQFTAGNLLQFAIFLGSITPVAFGIQFADLDRHEWTYTRIVFSLTFAFVSIVSALAHLFLTYRNRPVSWQRLVMRSIYWLVFAPVLFYFWYSVFPGVHSHH